MPKHQTRHVNFNDQVEVKLFHKAQAVRQDANRLDTTSRALKFPIGVNTTPSNWAQLSTSSPTPYETRKSYKNKSAKINQPSDVEHQSNQDQHQIIILLIVFLGVAFSLIIAHLVKHHRNRHGQSIGHTRVHKRRVL